MNATMTELAAVVADRTLAGVCDVAFAEAVDDFLDEVLDDAADTVEALLGDLGDADVFAAVVLAVAESRLRSTAVSLAAAA